MVLLTHTAALELCEKLLKSHPRQWVDGSESNLHPSARAEFTNPTNGSWWIVQIRPPMEQRQSGIQRSEYSFITFGVGQQAGI